MSCAFPVVRVVIALFLIVGSPCTSTACLTLALLALVYYSGNLEAIASKHVRLLTAAFQFLLRSRLLGIMANGYPFSTSVRTYWRAWLLASGLLLADLGAAQALFLPVTAYQPGSAPANSLNFGFGILRVHLANVDTTTRGATDGYQDYRCRLAVRLGRGTTYALRVITGPSAEEQVRAWVDFNQDGMFSPTTELIFSSVGRRHAGSFTVPTTLSSEASLRLRLVADYVDAPISERGCDGSRPAVGRSSHYYTLA
jgi:hypothetical protein